MTKILLPGSFRPPHREHLRMIEYYSKIASAENGTVDVIISNPKKEKRLFESGKSIEASTVKEILEIYCKKLKNVNILIAENSPVKYCYDYGETANGTLIFGCSTKGDDIKRFESIVKYLKNKNPNVLVKNPMETAFNFDTPLNASDFRYALEHHLSIDNFMPKALTVDEDVFIKERLFSLL